jgi:polyhydroxybutyrate depolymerase
MRRTLVLSAVLACIGVPPLLVLLDAAAFYAANRTTGTITTSAGQRREYILYVPKTYDRSKPTPLVISIHGAVNWPSFQMNLTQWNTLADEQGFIVVYPGGQGGAVKTWHQQGRRNPRRMPDVVFISELIDTLQRSYHIDPARIYANGLSNGGGMSYTLSCTLQDRIAAFGPVGSAVFEPDWCPDERPAPAIIFHGTADPLAQYHGGKVWMAPEPFANIPDWTATWARRNRCAPDAIDTRVASDVTRREYTNCANDAAVILYTIEGGGHTWPGGTQLAEWMLGPTNRHIDATRVMWKFFLEHPLRRP